MVIPLTLPPFCVSNICGMLYFIDLVSLDFLRPRCHIHRQPIIAFFLRFYASPTQTHLEGLTP
jgi:hypothetical protein